MKQLLLLTFLAFASEATLEIVSVGDWIALPCVACLTLN
jgi:hypothetical protein